MEAADWLYIAMFISIAVFFWGLVSFARQREAKRKRQEQEHNSPVLQIRDEAGFEQPLWKGKAQTIVADDERHEAEFDVIVYVDSVFIGFTEQGFPFLTLSASQIKKVIGDKGRVRILFEREDGRDIYYQLHGNQIRGLAEKVDFIHKRAHYR